MPKNRKPKRDAIQRAIDSAYDRIHDFMPYADAQEFWFGKNGRNLMDCAVFGWPFIFKQNPQGIWKLTWIEAEVKNAPALPPGKNS